MTSVDSFSAFLQWGKMVISGSSTYSLHKREDYLYCAVGLVPCMMMHGTDPTAQYKFR
jgi:hypothetical protein